MRHALVRVEIPPDKDHPDNVDWVHGFDIDDKEETIEAIVALQLQVLEERNL